MDTDGSSSMLVSYSKSSRSPAKAADWGDAVGDSTEAKEPEDAAAAEP